MWKFTWDRAFPHVEIHQKLWISQRAEILIFWCISTSGNSSRKVNFRMSIYKRIREFPRGKTCGNTRFFGDFHMRKYTRKCEFPHAEIHAERCITACGNTLNQVQKNSSKMKMATVQKAWLSPQKMIVQIDLLYLQKLLDNKCWQLNLTTKVRFTRGGSPFSQV